MGTTTYAYDGDSNRISQNALTYILDTQPGLTKVLGDSTGNRYMHSPRGIHAMYDGADWSYAVQDGLGSVRMEVGASVSASQNYTPYGEAMDVNGSFDSPFGFTGEQTDGNSQVYLRARYYTPSMGVFSSLDPFEGIHNRPMSLNGYSWVEGNPVMNTDASGRCVDNMVLGNLSGRFLLGNRSASLARLINNNSGNNSTNNTTLYQTGTPEMSGTQCEQFIEQLRFVITRALEQMGLSSEQIDNMNRNVPTFRTTILLSQIYSKLRFPDVWVIGMLTLTQPWEATDIERWPMTNVPTADGTCGDTCLANSSNPMYYRNSSEGVALRQQYGFKRFFFDNTHHFFAFLGFAAWTDDIISDRHDYDRERGNLCHQAKSTCRRLKGIPHPSGGYDNHITDYQLWYDDAAADRYVVHLAHEFTGRDIRELPDFLKGRICASSEVDIWREMDDIVLKDYAFHEFHPDRLEENCDAILDSDCVSDLFSNLP